MLDLECKCKCPDEIRDLCILLMEENPRLTVETALEYSRRICAAEHEEDYILMYKLIQEALYGKGHRDAA